MPFEIDPSRHLTVGILSPLRSRFLLFVFDKGKNDRVVFYARQQLCREREREEEILIVRKKMISYYGMQDSAALALLR